MRPLFAAIGLLVAAGCTATAPTPVPVDPTQQPALGPDIVWRTEVTGTEYALVGDTIIATWWGGVTGIEADTGKTRWDYRAPDDFSVVSWGATANVVAVVMDDSDVTEPTADYLSSTIGLETASGRQLWEDPPADLYPLPEYTDSTAERFASWKELFIVPWFGTPLTGLAGVDTRAGTLSWTTVFDDLDGVDQCDIIDGNDSLLPDRPLVAVGDRLAVVAVRCVQGQFVIGFDPGTGRGRWATPLPGGEPERLIIDDDVILVGQVGRGTVVDSDGRVLFEGALPPERLVMAVSGDVMLVSGQDGSSDPLVAIDLRAGRTLWSQPRPGPDLRDTGRPNTYLELLSVGTGVLGFRTSALDPQPPEIDTSRLPAVADRIDPLTGTTRPLVVPVADGPGWSAAVGDTLVLGGGRELLAIRLAPDGSPPEAYSPAPPDRWPDACALLTADHLRTLWPGVDVTSAGKPGTVLGNALPNPVRCDVSDRSDEVLVTVFLRWVADDPAGAAGVAATAHSVSAGTDPESTDDVAPLLPAVGTWAFGDAATSVTLRAGPVIATVRAWDIAVPAVELARLITTQLHAQGYR